MVGMEKGVESNKTNVLRLENFFRNRERIAPVREMSAREQVHSAPDQEVSSLI